MAYVLSTVKRADQPKFATNVVIGADQRYFVAHAAGTRLILRTFQPTHAPYLEAQLAYSFPDQILALTCVPNSSIVGEGPKSGLVCVLLWDRIHLLDLNSKQKLEIVLTIKIDLVHGYQRAPEIDPILLASSLTSKDNFLVIYQHTGFVTVVDLLQFLKPDETKNAHNKRSRKSKSSRIKTFPIGHIAVVLMTSINLRLFAVLYRDIEFNHLLRFYDFDENLNKLTLVDSCSFADAPTLAFKAGHGVAVFSQTQVYLIPLPSQKVYLGESAAGRIMKDQLKEKYCLSYSLLNLGLRCYTKIDEKRFILITDDGESGMLYIETEKSMANITVQACKVVTLGKTTIATSICSITDNILFAASESSTSVLFRVIPKQPHIEILSSFEGSPPVLDLSIEDSGLSGELLVACGGFHSGEIRKLSLPSREVSLLNSVEVGPSAINIASISVSENHLQIRTLEGLDEFLLKNLKSSNRQTIDWHEVNRSWTVPGASIELSENGPLTLTATFESLELKALFLLTEISQVSDIACTFDSKSKELTAYVVLWSGDILAIKFEEGKLSGELLQAISLPFEGKCNARIHEGVLIVLQPSGLLHQLNLESFEATSIRAFDPKEQLFLSTGGELLAYSSREVYRLEKLPNSSILFPKKLFRPPYPIRACASMKKGSKTVAFVLQIDGVLSKYEVQKSKSSNRCFYSDKLILRIVQLSEDYSVALEMELKADRSGKLQQITTLLLFNPGTLKILHRYTPPGSICFVDMCNVKNPDSKDQNYLVALNSENNFEALLTTFTVSKKQLKVVRTVIANATLPAKLAFVKICSSGSSILLTGNCNARFTLELDYEDNLIWQGQPLDSAALSYYGVDSDMSNELQVVADATRGIYIADFAGKVFRRANLPHSPSFPSAVALVKGEKHMLMYGDSAGNLCLAKELGRAGRTVDPGFEAVFACNIDEHINVIRVVSHSPLVAVVGTAKGGIYRVQYEQLGEETLAEFGATKKRFEKTGVHYGKTLGDSWKEVDGSVMANEVFGIIEGDVFVKADKEGIAFADPKVLTMVQSLTMWSQ